MTAVLQAQPPMSTADALALFDSLEPVDLDFMMGRWVGAGFDTHHPMDGLLETFGWYGKAFVTPDDVHPLLFRRGGSVVSISPRLMPMGLLWKVRLPRSALLNALSLPLKFALRTRRARARVRMMEHRGKVSATMIYDDLPIHDVFRKFDDATVLGAMDLKGMPQPFFFQLRREGA
ncbi:DUF4334 domain-containing protein [Cystobacter ferrugineus]|nr:DUF4334 domain-containing protein [Cystobacter ferrugineus]